MDSAVIACNPNGSAYLYYFSEEQKSDMPNDLRNGLSDYDALVESYSEEYQQLSKELYECIDDILWYQSGMMPDVYIPEVNASTEVAKLTKASLSPIGLSTVNSYTSTPTVNSALKNFAKVLVKSGFVKVEIDYGNFVYEGTDDNNHNYGKWIGKFKITNYSDEEDIAYSEELEIKITDDYDTFLKQKILKNISSSNDDEDSVYNVLNIKSLNKFCQALLHYSYNRLESFADAIQGVINVLIEENQGQKDCKYYEEIYVPYYNKLKACQEEMNARAKTIETLEEKQEVIINRQAEIRKALNMKVFLGEDLYNLFCAYRREDTYQNDNFISDGLSNEEIFLKANEFIELAKNEIVKSGEHQHSISSNLYNLLVMKEFAPIKDKFELGNWIKCKVDNEVYRLRLISYEINGNSLSNINTEFSELTKTANGVNDIKSILDKAQSMATSYQYVSKQSSQGKKAQDTIIKFVNEGLNSSLVNIKNNTNEEVTYDNNGILCRTWDDVEGDYHAEQLRITHNLLAFTDDNWKSCSLGLGKHSYYYYDDKDVLQRDIGYGLSSRFVQSGVVNGSQIIGGKIYSENYSPTSGTYFNLNDGKFSLGGGKITYDGKDITLTGITLKWSDIDGTPTDLSYFTNDLGFQTEDQVTTITKDTIATTNVIAKNLRVQSANIEGTIHADSVNAENIIGDTFKGKTILLGGANNGDGSIVVKDNNGEIILTIGVDGIQVRDGMLNFMQADELYILNGATLDSKVNQYGFSSTGYSLKSECNSAASKDKYEAPTNATTKQCRIENIDLTNYSKMTITSICLTCNSYGTAYVNFGIDTANNTFYSLQSGDGSEERTVVRTLDISGYTGIHNLVFSQYAKSDSSYWGYVSYANLGLVKILLHN